MPLSEVFCVQQRRALEEVWGFVAVLISSGYAFDLCKDSCVLFRLLSWPGVFLW